MNPTQIKTTIHNAVYNLAAAIDPIKLIGDETVAIENRPLSQSERQAAQNQHRKILKDLKKKCLINKEE